MPGWVGANALIVTVRVVGALDAVTAVPLRVAPVQVTTPADSEHENAFGPLIVSRAEMNPVPAGSTSRNATPKAGSVPVLLTTRVYVMTLLVATVGVDVLVMVNWWKAF